MKIFKKLVTLALCFLLAFTFASCSEVGSGSTDDGQITLKIQSAAPLRYNFNALLNSEEEGTQLYNQALFSKKLVEGFKALYPNIKLNFIEHGWGEALFQKQQLMVRSYMQGNKIDVDIMIGEPYMNYLSKAGIFSELDKTKFSHVIEGSYSDMVVDGKLYGVPMCTGIMGLQYNTQILAEAGIPEAEWVPTTWAQLLENSKKVSEYAKNNQKSYGGIMLNNVSGMSGAFRAVPFMRQAGGDFVDESGNLTLNSAANKEAFAYLRELAKYAYKEGLTTENEDTLQYYFINKGLAAYMVEGQWSMANAPDYIKSAALPSKDEASTATGNIFMGNVLFGVTKGSANQEAAKAFLEYLTSEQVQKWFYELDGRLPINKDVLSSEETRAIYPNINSYIDVLLKGGFEGGLAGFVKNSGDIWNSWGTFYKKVLTTDENLDTLLTDTHNYIQGKLA